MNESMFGVLGLGLLLGLKHALEADHVVAVTAIVSEHASLSRAALIGALWGVGHTFSLLLAGVALIFLRVAIPAPVAAVLEFAVALMIIVLGGRILYALFRGRRTIHVHTHSHDGVTHSHLHFHDRHDAHEPSIPYGHGREAHDHKLGWRPIVVGMVHGLAGSAALTLLILTESVLASSKAMGIAYLVVFGFGSICGMLLMSLLLGIPFTVTALRAERLNAPIRLMTGVGSVAFGVYFAWASVLGV